MDEFKSIMKEITTSDKFSADVKTLWDLRQMSFINIDINFGEQLVMMRRQSSERGNAKIALIADKDSAFGLSRMYAAISDSLPQSIMVFRDYESGREWLLS